MPALVDLLDQFFFPDVPGAQARDALVHAWELASGMTWDALYAQSLDDALSEELPHLSAYSGANTPRPTLAELAMLVRVDLGEAGNHLLAMDRNSGTFLTELARAMQAQRLIIINQHNLFTDEYRQILLNFFDHAHVRFKAVVTNHEPEFTAALASTAGYDKIVIASISNFLDRAFNVTLPSMSMSAQAPAEKVDAPETPPPPVMQQTESENPVAVSTPLQREAADIPASTSEAAPPVSVPPAESEPRTTPNRLRVLIATPADVLTERAQLIHLVSELDAQARARFGLELAFVNPSSSEIASVTSAAELADIFIGAVWLQFGAASVETNAATNETFFAGTEQDFGIALEQGSERNDGWLRTVVYRSIRPPLDLLHLNVGEYTRVQQFFERASAYGGEDLVRVYNDANELLADARARLDAWIYNYAGDVANALSEYGKTSAANGQSADALADFDQAIALYRELDRPELEMGLWFQMGVLQRRIQNREQAAQSFDAALRLANRLEEDETAANALYQIGLLNADAGDWRAAQRSYHQARARLKPDAALYRTIIADEISAFTNLGDAERASNQFDHASDAYRDALALAQEIDDNAHIVALHEKLGGVAAQSGSYQAAVDAFGKAIEHLDVSTPAETRYALYDGQANAHAQLAAIARDAGKTDEAEKSFSAALDANAHGSRNQAHSVDWHSALGALAAQREDWEGAIAANEHALAALENVEDTPQRRSLLTAQANAYQQLGETRFGAQQLDAAANAYRDALMVYQELDAREEQGDVLTQLGAVSAAQSRWQEAVAYFNQAIPRLNASGAQPLRQRAQRAQAIALTHIGDAHRDAQEWGQAEIAYMQARGNLEQVGSSAETGELLVNLGIVTAAQARWQEALAFYQQARSRLTAPEHAEIYKHGLRAETDTLREIAALRVAASDYTQAEATYRQQLDLAQELDDTELQAEALAQMGRVAADSGRWDDAVDLYERALGHVENAAPGARAPIQRDQLVAYEKIGERERAVPHFPQTEMAYRSALTLAQELNEREQEAELLNILGLVSIEQENWEEALVNLRRALGIYNLMPTAPEKSKVIWNIGRAQRGQKRAQLSAILARVHATRERGAFSEAVTDLQDGLQLARELGDAHTEGFLRGEQGDVAASNLDWDNALTAYEDALPKLTEPTDAERRTAIQQAQIHALRQRSATLREAHHWAQADADLSVALGLARSLNDSQTQGELVYESGLVASGQARWNDAIDLYSVALDTLGEGSEQRPVIEGAQADAYRELGNNEFNGQNWQGAEASYTQALSLQRHRGDNAAQATLLSALGEVAMRQGEWRSAVDWLTQARPLMAETSPEQITSLDGDLERAQIALKREEQGEAEARGDTQRAAHDFQNAAASYTQALELAEELQDQPARAELNAKLGFVATERGELENALAYYRAAAGGYDATENAAQRSTLVELQAQTLQDLGNRAGENGQWEDALARYGESIALLDTPAQSDQRRTSVELSAITLQNIGDKARTDAQWGKALDAYRRAAGMFGIVGATDAQRVVWSREADMLTNLARQARAKNSHDEALQLYRTAADQFIAAQNFTALDSLAGERVTAYHEAGDALVEANRANDAAAAYQAGYALVQQTDDHAAQADLLYQLGQLQAGQEEWKSALAYYHAAYTLADEMHESALRANITHGQQQAYHTLGDKLRAEGSLAAAEENYNGALTAALEQEDHENAGELYFILGMLAADNNAWDKALGNYTLALEQMNASKSPHRNDVISYQTFAFQQWGDLQRGAGQYDSAASAYASALERADELSDNERAGEILYRQGLIAAAHGDWQAALDAYGVAETRLPDASETRPALASDIALAQRALERIQLAAQLEHAQYARQKVQWEDAATAYRAALPLAQKLDDTLARSQIERDLVMLYADKAHALRAEQLWDETDDAYRESLLLAREFHLDDEAGTREADLVALHTEQANLERNNKKWDEANDAYRKGLSLAREFHLNEQAHAREADLVGLHTEQAELLRGEQDWAGADASYRASLDLAREFQLDELVTARQVDLVGLHTEQAELLRGEQDWAGADTAYRASLALAREFHLDEQTSAREADLVGLHTEQANLLRSEQDWTGANDAYRVSLDLAREFHLDEQASARQADLVGLHTEQANLLRDKKDWTDANDAYRVSLDLAREFHLDEQAHAREADLVGLHTEQAELLRGDKDWAGADAAYRASLDLAREFQLDGEASALQVDLVGLHTEQAELLHGEKDRAGADTAYRASLALAREFQLTDQVHARESDLIALHTEQANLLRDEKDWTGANEAYRASLALAREFQLNEQARARQEDLVGLYTQQADLLRSEQDWAGADTAYRASLDLAREFQLDELVNARQVDLVTLHTEQAELLRGEQDWTGANDAYRVSLDLAREFQLGEQASAREADLVGLHTEQANLLRSEQDWTGANDAYRVSLDLAREFQLDEQTSAREADLVGLHAEQAELLRGEKDWAGANDAYRVSLELAREFQLDEQASARKADMVGLHTEQAELLRGEKDWAGADAAYRASLDLAREFQLDELVNARQVDLVGLHTEQAELLRGEQDRAGADTAYRASLALAREFHLDEQASARQADIVTLAAEKTAALRAQQKWAEAHDAAQGQLDVATEFGDSASQGDALYELGRIAHAQDDLPTALDYYTRARPLLADAHQSDTLQQLDTANQSATQLLEQRTAQENATSTALSAQTAGRWDEADAAYRQALSIAQELNDVPAQKQIGAGLVVVATARIHTLQEQTDWEGAERAAHRAVVVAQEFEDAKARADALYQLGRIAAEQKHWYAAQDYYTQARTLMGQEPSDTLARLDTDLATANDILERQAHQVSWVEAGQYAFTGQRYEDAASALHASLDLNIALGENGNPARQADALYELGRVAVAQGQWETAQDYFEQARPLLVEQNRSERVAALDEELGATKQRIDRIARLAQAQTNAQNAFATQRFDDATAAYREAFDIAGLLENQDALQASRAGLLETSAAKVNALEAASEWGNAATAAQDALTVAREFQAGDSEAATLSHLGKISVAQTQWQPAKEYFTKAAEIYSIRNDAPHAAEALYEANQADAVLDRQARLATALTAAQSARESKDWVTAQNKYRSAYTLAQELGDTTAAENLCLAMQDIAATQTKAQMGAGDWADAERSANEQLALAQEFQDSAAQAEAFTNLGAIAAAQRHWQPALAHYGDASRLFTTLDNSARVAEIETATAEATREWQSDQYAAAQARGELALENGRWQESESAYAEALELAHTLNDPRRSGETQIAIADVAVAQKQWDTATERLDAALTTVVPLNDVALTGSVQTKLVHAASAAGDEHATRQEWDAANQAYTLGLERAGEAATPAERTHLLQQLGSLAAEQNNLTDAIAYYDRALAETIDRNAILAPQAQVWQHIGDNAMDAHQFAPAQDAYEHALALYTELQQPTQRAEVLHSIGLVQTAQGKPAEALDAHQQAFALVHDLDMPAVHVEMLRSIADTQRTLGQNEQARTNYQLALQDADKPAAGEIEFALGQIAVEQSHWQDALAHFDAAQAHLDETGDTTRAQTIQTAQADANANLGDVLFGEGQWSEAEDAFTRALTLDSATGRADRDGTLHSQIGLTHAAQEMYQDAAAHYDQALALLPEEEVALRDRVIGHLAHALQQQGKRAEDAGDLARAETAYVRAIKMAEASDNFDQVADLWFRLGGIYTTQGRDDDALRAYRRAYDFDRRDGNALQEHAISDALGNVLLRQGQGALKQADNTQAETNLQEALTFAENSENPQLLGQTLQALGDVSNAQGDRDEAIELYARAGRTFASIEDTDRWRVVSQQQAGLVREAASQQLDANEFSDAENLYRRAWLLQQASGDTLHDAETHFGLGRALLAQERSEDALAELEQADAGFNKDAPQRPELKALHTVALEAIGGQAIDEARWLDAQDALTRAANYRDELNERTQAGLDWQKLAEIAAQQNEFNEAVGANEQALARLDTPEMSDARHAVLKHQAHILATIGDQQQEQGDWENASDTYRRALDIAQEQGDLTTLAQLYTLLGSLGAAQEHWADAQTEYHHALDVYQELDQPTAQAETWTRLGDMHRQATQYDDATKAFTMARDLYHQTGNRLQEGAMLQRLGHVQGDREEWDGALDEYQNALHLYIEINARREKPEVYRAMERAVRNAKLKSADQAAAQGDEHLTAGAWAEAENSYRDALELYTEADEHILQAQMQNQRGVALEAQMRFDEALEQYHRALSGFEELNIPEAQVGVLANIGDVQRSRKQWNQAEAAYRQALALNEMAPDTQRAGELYNSLGAVREAQGDWEQALEYYQAAVGMFEEAGENEARDNANENLVRARRGVRRESEAGYKRELEAARAAGNYAEAGEILNTLGLMAAEDNKYDEALDYYRQAVATFEKLEAEEDMDPVWRTAQGTVLNNIGDASQQIGAWGDADYAYTRALGLAREIGDHESEAILLRNLGIAAQEQAQLPRALDLNYQALDTYRKLGDETPRAELLERVGNLQLELAQTSAAEATYTEALETARATNDTERIPRLLTQLGILAEERGEGEQALEYYNEALERSTELQRVEEQKSLWIKQGALYARSSQWEEAERAQNAALALATQQGDESLQADLHTHLGQSAAARGDWSAARQHDQQALALYETLNAPIKQMELHERIGHAYAATGEAAAADESYRAALELAPRVEGSSTRPLWEARAALAEKHNRWSEAASFYESARAELPADAPAEERIDLLFRSGDAAMHARDWHAADVSYNDALELANVADNRVQYGLGLNRLGLLTRAQRQTDEALDYFQEAIEILRQNNQPLAEAHVLNNIARLKLETNNPAEAELYGQAALAIAQALGSGQEASNSLYLRGLLSMDTQEFGVARRFLNQSIAANPANWAAQLQLGNALLADGFVSDAVQQAEAGRGQSPDWELGAQTQITIAALYQEDTRNYKTHLKRTRSMLSAGAAQTGVAPEVLAAVEWVVRAMEGDAENVLAELNAANSQPARTVALDAQRFARTALLALSKSPRRFKGKPTLVTFFAMPKPRTRKGGRPRRAAASDETRERTDD